MVFRALVTRKDEAGAVHSQVETLENAQLPQGNVTIDVAWAGLNYKDGLCLSGKGGLVRDFPHVGGIDFSGTVRESADERYKPGDAVVLTGWRVGETHWGGFSERARVSADWLVPLPNGLSLRDAMVVGTAGLTAMLAIERLERAGIAPDSGDVLVTGASGGVGTIALALLSRLGFSAVALSGRPENAEGLLRLGAARVLGRNEFLHLPDKPLESAQWTAAIDNVGGAVLGKLLRQIRYGGAVASIGNAGGIALHTNVLPFILRGVSLLGVDSVMQPYTARLAAWERLAASFDLNAYGAMVREIGLADLPEAGKAILGGEITGRTIVRIG